MNLRCLYCQTPFTLSRAEMLTAITIMNEKNLNHYDAHCPRCRRANSISRQRMELFFPNWREAAKQMASAPASSPPVPASASMKTEPLSKAVKKSDLKTSTSKTTAAEKAKPSGSKRKRASKPATAKKTTASSKSAPAKKTTSTASKSAAKKTSTTKPKKTTTKSGKKK